MKAYIKPLMWVGNQFRKNRFGLFLDLLKDFEGTERMEEGLRILDIGGREAFWESMGFANSKHQFTILNVEDEKRPPRHDNFKTVVGDARKLTGVYRGDYDLVFSNSVIEHVGKWEDQVAMASEIHRIADAYLVQTPNYYFPLEPHFHVPYFQMMPLEVRTKLIQRYQLGCMPKLEDAAAARQLAEETRLVKRDEMARLFPDAELREERILGLTKSFIALKHRSAHPVTIAPPVMPIGQETYEKQPEVAAKTGTDSERNKRVA